MKGFHERWETQDAKVAQEYPRAVIESGERGLGHAWKAVLVVGRQNLAANGGGRSYTFDFLWIQDPHTRSIFLDPLWEISDVRPASGMSLCESRLIFDQSHCESYETLMRGALDTYDDVAFVEEYIPAGTGDVKYQCRVIQSREVSDSALRVCNEEHTRYRADEFVLGVSSDESDGDVD